MKFRVLGLLIAAIGVSVCADEASAGERHRLDVVVQNTYRYAYGSISSARDSSDTTQSIGCYVQTTIAVCHAKSSSGAFAMCYTTKPEEITLLRAIDSGSAVFFNWDQYGMCSGLQISNYSYYGNKGH